MNNKIIAIVIVAVIAVAAVGIGMSQLMKDNDDGPIVDSRGRTVEVGEIDTILCHNCCSLELTSYFKAVDKVVAIDKNDAIAPNKTYTQVYKTKFAALDKIDCSNLESIIVLNPSIVVTSTVAVEDIDNMQQKLDIPVYAINADLEFGDDAWFEQIEKLGKLFDEKDRAKQIVDGVKSIISEIREGELTTDVTGYACGMMFYGSGPIPFLKVSGDYLPFIFSGMKNSNASSNAGVGKQPYVITAETAAAESFDYVFADAMGAADVVAYINDHRSELEATVAKAAFTNGHVYRTMAYKMWGTQWDNQLINCLYVAKTVNPSAYSWEFEDKADEVFKVLYGEGKYTYSQVTNKCGHLDIA